MQSEFRAGERLVTLPEKTDEGVYFIGRIHTPWRDRKDCPRQGSLDGPECRIEIFAPWDAALQGLDDFDHLEILYWLDRSRRDLALQNPHGDGRAFHGTFALRSPQRPNPIGTSKVRLVRIDGASLVVRGLDCLDGTPLIDIKPDRCEFSPKAAPK